jgi:predicted PurR-regulated permease PerM
MRDLIATANGAERADIEFIKNSRANGEQDAPPPRRSMTHLRIATTARVMFIVVSGLALAYFARSVVIPVLLAWFISMMLKPPVRWLWQCRCPVPVGAAVVVTLVVVAVSFASIHLGRPALVWLNTAPDTLPQIRQKFQHILRPAVRLSEAASSVGNLGPAGEIEKKAQPVEVKDNHVMGLVFTWTSSVLAGAAETVALLFLLLAFGDLFMNRVVRILPTLREKKQAVEMSRQIHHHVSKYLFSVGVVNVCFGIVIALAMYGLGMPNAMMWGGLAALANFIPYFGPALGVMVIGLGGLLAFDTLGKGLMPAAVYLVAHLLEANLITPVVLGRRFTLNPVIIFVALIFCIWLWGIVGALLAVPLLVTLKVVCEHIPALSHLGELLAGSERPVVAPPAPDPTPA